MENVTEIMLHVNSDNQMFAFKTRIGGHNSKEHNAVNCSVI